MFFIDWSEVSRIICHIPTNTTSKRIFFTVWWMLYFKRTLILAWTFWQLVSRFSWHIITVTLSLVTRLTKMCVTPAEPLGNRAAKFAFKFYEISSVLRTSLDATSNSYCRAFSTNQFFSLEIVIIVLAHLAVLLTSKVRLITFEALIIGEFVKSVRLNIFVMNIWRIIELFVLV